MKALFTTFPALGHLLPMLPLARAVAAHGDDVVVATAQELHSVDQELPMLELGPGMLDLLAEAERRAGTDLMGYRTDSTDLLAPTVELFTTTRVDASFDDLHRRVVKERPDVIVAERGDFVAPLVATSLGIPWVFFEHSPATEIDSVLERGMRTAAERRGLDVAAPSVAVSTWPDWLESDAFVGGPHGAPLALKPVAHDSRDAVDLPAFTGHRPVVLVTLGTVVDDPHLLETSVRSVLDAGADALATTGATDPREVAGLHERVQAVSFAPIAQLLDRVDAVVAAGGSGTTLAALSRGLPLAFVPQFANQPLVASVVASFGAGLVHAQSAELANEVHGLLHDESYRERAGDAAALLAARLSPVDTWLALREQVRGRTG